MLDRSESLAGTPDRTRSPAAVAAAGLVALAVAMGVGRFAFTPILPMMQEDTGLSVAAGGWLASANYAGYLVGALSAIGLRIRAATAIRGGLVVIGLATLGMGLDGGFAVWVVLRALAGVASAWVLVSVSAWCLERLAALRGSALNGRVFAGVGTGIAAAGVLCLALMHASAGSAQAWIALGILSFAFMAMVWPIFGDGAMSATPARPGERGLRWDGESVRLILCYGAFGFGYIIPATFLPVMAKQVIQDPAVFGWAWPVFGAAAAVSTLAAAALPRFVAGRRLWSLSQFVMALGVALPVFWPGVVGIMLAALLVGGTFMVVTMAGMQEARQVAGEHARALMAAMTSAFALGQIAGPLSVSFVVGADGGFSEALLAASLLLATSAYALSYRRAKEPPQ
jgi:predicted MFS family arabinose efflux permease